MNSQHIEGYEDVLEKTVRINASLPPYAEPRTVSYTAKIPFKALSVRELLIHRIANLSQVACKLLDGEEYLSSIIISRAVVETTAVIYYIDKKMKECLDKDNIEGFDDTVIKLLFGSRNEMTEVISINILTLIEHWSKEKKK